MSRRFDSRLKCQLPIKLNSNGDDAIEGIVSDVSATHFRGQFSNAISTYKRYEFKLTLPDNQLLTGLTRVHRANPKHADGKYTYIFVMENLPVHDQVALLACIEQGQKGAVHERRQSTADLDYGKNRRQSDRDTSRLGRQRVVITGIGVVCSNAIGRAAYWSAIQQHKSGIGDITLFDATQFPVKIAGEVPTKILDEQIPRRKASHMGRATKMAWLAAKLAMEDAEFNAAAENRDRIGVAMGTTLGALDWAFDQHASLHSKGYRAEHPYTVAAGSANAVSGEIAVEYGARGPSLSFSQGCSSSSMAVAHALDLIQTGRASVMLVGGADAPLNPTVFGAFVRSGMLSQSALPSKGNVIARKDFAGTILGEGGCVLVLESYDHALQRGAPIYAEVLASGSASEGHHMLFPDPSGRGTARAIREAITMGKVDKESIDLVMGHVAGIREAYDVEMKALRRELGNRLEHIPITNVKSLIGYTQGACGAFELAAACLAFQDSANWITYERSFPPMKATKVLINCVGFGGKNVSLLLQNIYDR